MSESEFRELIELTWRRSLRADELARVEAWLANHPADRAEWENEALLSRHLASLPDVPVSSNFTALVMQAVDREAASARRAPSAGSWFQRLFGRPMMRLAWAIVMGGAVWIGYQEHQAGVRADVAKGLTVLVGVAKDVATPTLQDFDAIRSLGESEDDALYTALNQ